MPGGCACSAALRKGRQQGLEHHADEEGAMRLGRSSATAVMKDFSAPPYCMATRAVGNHRHLADLCGCSHERLLCTPVLHGNGIGRTSAAAAMKDFSASARRSSSSRGVSIISSSSRIPADSRDLRQPAHSQPLMDKCAYPADSSELCQLSY